MGLNERCFRCAAAVTNKNVAGTGGGEDGIMVQSEDDDALLEKFPHSPILYYACRINQLCMRSIVFEDNGSLNIYIDNYYLLFQ